MEQDPVEKHQNRIDANWEWKIQPNDKAASLRDKKSAWIFNHIREDKQYKKDNKLYWFAKLWGYAEKTLGLNISRDWIANWH